MSQINLFPAFESPEQSEGLHTKGIDCVCRPFYKEETNDQEITFTKVAHRPLTEANKAPEKRSSWLPKEGDPEWQT